MSPIHVQSPYGLKIVGAWTKAGIGSSLHVKGNMKKEDFLFDCGIFDDSTLQVNAVFISHSHVDHIAGSIPHARAKALIQSPCKYYIPFEAVQSMEKARIAFGELDGNDIPMEVIAVKPGDIIPYNDNLIVKVFQTEHRIASQGYAVYSLSRCERKQCYQNLDHDEMKTTVGMGIDIYEVRKEILEVVYTGDTIFNIFLNPMNHFLLSAPILITECTYLDGPIEKAIQYGHIHIQDLISNVDLFDSVKYIVLVHISIRYSTHTRILEILNSHVPDKLKDKLFISLKLFGSSFPLNNLNYRIKNNKPGWGWASTNSSAKSSTNISKAVSLKNNGQSICNEETSYSYTSTNSTYPKEKKKFRASYSI